MRLFITLAIAASFHSSVQAQSTFPDSTKNHLNDVIINENRLQIPFASQNRNIYILDKAQINQLPVQSISELLSYVSGVDVRQRGPWGAQADISIDGGSFEQVTILVNGVKMNDPQTGHNSMNLPIPVNAIERIEVLRGSAARVYGVNSLTGAINFVTIKPNRTGAEVQINSGSNFKDNEENPDKTYLSKGIQLMGNYANEHQNHIISGSFSDGTGHRYNTAFKNNKLFYQGNISFKPNQTLTFMTGYVYNNFGANGFYAAPGDKESLEITQTGMASIGYETQLSERVTINPRINYRYNDDDYRYYKHDLSKARNRHYTHVINPEINANYKTNFGDFGFGTEVRFDKINSSNLGDHTRSDAGFYTEFRTEEIKNFQFSAGIYANYNSTFGWRVYPGLDIGYSLAQNWKVYVNSGSGQRVPSLTDLYYDTPANIGNENLNPESAWYAEGGLKYNNGNLWMNASYFYRKVDNLIDWVRNDVQEAWRSENFLQNTVKGLTLSADYRINKSTDWNLITGVSYTYLDARMNQKGLQFNLSKYALESLKHQLSGKLMTNFKKVSFSITERFQERIQKKSYFLTDFRLGYSFNRYYLFADATNIFDKQYIEVAQAPMPGRWFNLGLKVGI